MLVEGEGVPQNDLDTCKGYFLVGSPIMILILVGDICLLGLTFSAWLILLHGFLDIREIIKFS